MRKYGANLHRYTPVRWETGSSGMVDFGDGWHAGGRPQAYGVACWAYNGRAVVMGRVYADSPWGIPAKVKLTFYNAFGVAKVD